VSSVSSFFSFVNEFLVTGLCSGGTLFGSDRDRHFPPKGFIAAALNSSRRRAG